MRNLGNIVDKLIMGRNYLISEALRALHDLVERGFQFTKVVQTEAYFNAQNFASGIEAFVETHCILDGNSRESTSVLYETYIRFCNGHPEYKPKSINQFSSYIESKYGLKPYNDGNVRGKVGIQLCDHLRTDAVNWKTICYLCEDKRVGWCAVLRIFSHYGGGFLRIPERSLRIYLLIYALMMREYLTHI